MANVVKTTPYDNKGKLRKMKDIKAGEGNPCIFPFKHKRKLVNQCVDGKSGKWCATETDNKGKVLKWGYCVEEKEEEEKEEKKKKQKEKKKDSDPLIGKYKFLTYLSENLYLIVPKKKITEDSYEIDAVLPKSDGDQVVLKGKILVAGEEAGPEGFVDLTSIKFNEEIYQPNKYCVIDKDNNPVKSVGKNHDICGEFFDIILNNPKAFDYKKSKKKSEKKKSKSKKSKKQPPNNLIKVYFDISNIEKTLELNIVENPKGVMVKKFGRIIFDGSVKDIKEAFNVYQKERDRLARKYDIFNFEGLTDDEIQAKIPTFMYSKVDINTCDYDTSFVDTDIKLKDIENPDKKVVQIWNKNCFDIDELAQYLIATKGKNLDPIKQAMLQTEQLWRNEEELLSLMNHPYIDNAYAADFKKILNAKLTEMRMPSYVEIVNRSQEFMDRMAILGKICTEDYSSDFAPATEEIGRFIEYFRHTFSEEEVEKLNLIETKSGLTLKNAIANVHKHCIHGVGFRFFCLYCVAFTKTRNFLQSVGKPFNITLMNGVIEIEKEVFIFAHGFMRDNGTIRLNNGIPDQPTFIIYDEKNCIGQSHGAGRILKGNRGSLRLDSVWGFETSYAENKKKLVDRFYNQIVNTNPNNILNIYSNRKDKYTNDWKKREQLQKEAEMSPKSRKKSIKSRKENSIKKRTIKKTGRATKTYKKYLKDKIMYVYSDQKLLDMAAKYILDEYNPNNKGHMLQNSKGKTILFKFKLHKEGILLFIKEQKTKKQFNSFKFYIGLNNNPKDYFAGYILEKILDGYEDLDYGKIYLIQNPLPLSSSSSYYSSLSDEKMIGELEEKVKADSPKKSPPPAAVAKIPSDKTIAKMKREGKLPFDGDFNKAMAAQDRNAIRLLMQARKINLDDFPESPPKPDVPKMPSDKTIAKMKREGKLPFDGDFNKAMAAQDRNAIRLLMQARKINLDDFPPSPKPSPKKPAVQKMPSDKTIAKMKKDGTLPFDGDFNKAMAAQDRGAIRILMKARNINIDDFQQVEEAVQQGKVQLRKKSKTKNMIIKTGEQVKLTKKKKRVEPEKKEGLTTPKKKSPAKSPPAINRKKTLKKKSKSSNSSPNKVQWGIRINKQGQKIHEAENAKCIFPFTYKNKEYNNCINNNSKGGPWCATKVNPKTKKMVKYGYCPENERQKNYLAKIINTEKNNSGNQQPPKINAQELINKIPKYLDQDWIKLIPDSTNTKIVIANPKDYLFKSKELYLKKDGKIIETFSISFDLTDAKKYINSPLKYNSIRIELTTKALGKMPFTKSYIWKFSNIFSKVNPNKLIADKIKEGYEINID